MKYTYPFNYNFDYDLLLEDSKALSKYQVRHARTGLGKGYRKAENGEEITHWASKIHLLLDKNVADNPAIVDLPEPELPTKATTEPDAALKLILCKTGLSFSYSNETSLKIKSPFKASN